MAKILDAQLNEALRRAAWRDDGQRRFVPPAVAYTAPAGELAENLRQYTGDLGAGPGRPRVPRGPIYPRYINIQSDAATGAGPANVDRFSLLQNKPLVIEQISIVIAQGDPGGAHILLLKRRGDDVSTGITDDDQELWTYPEPIAGVGGILAMNGPNSFGPFPTSIVILDPPFRVHTRYITSATNFHGSVIYYCRIIEPEEFDDFAPTFLPDAYIFGRLRGPAPAPQRGAMAQPANNTPRGMQVCSLGFCRSIPWYNLAPELRREYLTNQFGGVATPGMKPIY